MCGICGIVFIDNPPIARSDLDRMSSALVHRGPDAQGEHIADGVWFAHRRLSIIDREGGRQPMVSGDGRVVLSYNGEIYNYRDLRDELEDRGHLFETESDTEVLLRLYEEQGEACVEKLRGMFAFSIWDNSSSTLLLARDGFGIKPLFVAQDTGWLAFASELQALLTLPLVKRQVNPDALSYFLTYDSVPAPHSLIQRVQKLSAGEILQWRKGKISSSQMSWPARPTSPALGSELTAEGLKETLDDSIRRHLVSDVPVGVFLSGGLDSSYIAAVASRHLGQLKTFSVSFTEQSFDESEFARLTAKHLGTEHSEIALCAAEARDLLIRTPEFIDEPLGDPAVIPMYLLSERARREVTVALSGEGADELFLGYPTYKAHQVARYFRALPTSLRRGLARMVQRLPSSDRNFSLDFILRRFLAGGALDPIPRHVTWMSALPAQKSGLFTEAFGSSIVDSSGLFPAEQVLHNFSTGNDALDASLLDLTLYLQDGILMRTDKVSMHHSLEVRVPFLDREVAAYAWGLALSSKLSLRQGKRILRQIATGMVPAEVAHRKKKGFGVPVSEWLKGPFREVLVDLLSEQTLRQQGIFNPATIHQLISEHMSGRENHRKSLWVLLIFQLWYRRWIKE